jgi:hypothetical protein
MITRYVCLLAALLLSSAATLGQEVFLPGTNIAIRARGLAFVEMTAINSRPALLIGWGPSRGVLIRHSYYAGPRHSAWIHATHALDTRPCIAANGGHPLWLAGGTNDIMPRLGWIPPTGLMLGGSGSYLEPPTSMVDRYCWPTYDNGWSYPPKPCMALAGPEWFAVVLMWSPE